MDSDSIRCLSDVAAKFPKGRSYFYRAAIRYFVSENQGKVTCKIGLGDDFLFRFVLIVPDLFSAYRTSCSLHIHVHLQGQTDPHINYVFLVQQMTSQNTLVQKL